MAPEHYFTSRPASAGDLRPLRVEIAGRMRELRTAGGVFSPGRLDTGTAVLLERVPAPPAAGDLLDLGCGWGPIALSLAAASPAATVWAVDVNERALDLVRRNAELVGAAGVRAVLPDEVPPEVRFAAIWSNPPIRVGKPALHGMLTRWLPRLRPGASAWLVVQKNLGADSLQRWLGETLPDEFATARDSSARGFRVLRVRRAAGGADAGDGRDTAGGADAGADADAGDAASPDAAGRQPI